MPENEAADSTSEATERERETILLVGASSDIGLETMRRLAADRPRILAHYNQSLDKLQALQQTLSGAEIIPIQADLAQPEGIDSLVATIRELRPLPGKFVHLPAPRFQYLRFKDATWGDFQRELDVQLRSLVTVLQLLLPEMARQKRGKVVVVLSSFTVGAPPAAVSAYVTAKQAMLGLVRALASEYSSKRLNINAVSPSTVETAFLQNLPERMVELIAAQSPFQRNAIPRDVAGAIRFLLSADSDYITGANLPISGGTAF